MVNVGTGGKYRFASTKENYEDYSSGRVLYGAPGATGFPVRLTSEIFQRAAFLLQQGGITVPHSVYDPFCGAGYSLTVVGLMHGASIKEVTASDVNPDILATARKNLSLLTLEGFDRRINELTNLEETYQKTSHREALESAERLKSKVPGIRANIFEFNMLGGQELPIPNSSVDLVLCDLPYGKLTQWENKEGAVPVHGFLTKIYSALKPKAVVAVSADKKQKIAHEAYTRLELMRIGKRQVVFLAKS